MAPNALPKRSEIPEVDRWRLEDIYPAPEDWESALAGVKSRLPDLASYQGRLGESARTLLGYLALLEETEKDLERIYAYASLRKDEDSTVGAAQSRYGKAQALWVEYSQTTSFFTPEMLTVDPDVIALFQQEETGLAVYAHMLGDISRRRSHTLDVEKEQLLAASGELAMGPHNIFNMINDADMKFGFIKDENGDEVELTKGRYTQFLENPNREVRRSAFETLYAAYGKQRNTLAAVYNASVKTDGFYARAHKHGSALASAVFDDNIDQSVYDNLIGSVNKNLDKLHRYVSLRKRVLGLPELHFYDLFVPMVKDMDVKKTFDEAKAMCMDALKPLGSDYLQTLGGAFESRWTDVYENEGKKSGAYSYGVYGVHPFILLNYQGNLDNVFTLAHEMGHAMHSHYSQKTQPYVYAHYTIFLAEVASTLNEALMMHYLLGNTTDRQMRIFLINHHLEQFRGTLYRQTMFAEFEKLTHEASEAGESLTQDFLCGKYRELNAKYYGPDIVLDDQIALEWARIPHFYRAFYVFQYSTGIAAATALSLNILRDGQPAVDRYIAFLSSGGSDYSLNLLARAGVDMRTPEPVDSALSLFGDLLTEMEQLISG